MVYLKWVQATFAKEHCARNFHTPRKLSHMKHSHDVSLTRPTFSGCVHAYESLASLTKLPLPSV